MPRKLIDLFMTFLKIGTFTLGGGLAMLPLIQKEFTEKKDWFSEEEIVDVLAICQSLPGIIAINSSIFIGYRMAGIAGAIVSIIAMSIPAFMSIIIVLYFLIFIRGNIYIDKAFVGVRAGVTALILMSAVSLSKSSIKDIFGIIIAASSFVAIAFLDISPIYVILSGAIIGIIYYNKRVD